MKIKTIVIDGDEENRAGLLWNLKFFGGFEIVKEMGSFEDLEKLETDVDVDVAFVALNLPTSDGFYCTYYLQKNFPDVRVVLIAKESSYAYDAYEYGIFDYILRPLDPMRLEKTVLRLKDAFQKDETIIESPKRIMVKLKGRYQMISFEDILFLEMRNRKCFLALQDGTEVPLQRYTMEQLEKMFTPFGFFRCYQSLIVQISKVTQLINNTENRNCTITLQGHDSELPVSRDKFSQMMSLLEENSGITVTGNMSNE